MYHQIESTDDSVRHCFENECTLIYVAAKKYYEIPSFHILWWFWTYVGYPLMRWYFFLSETDFLFKSASTPFGENSQIIGPGPGQRKKPDTAKKTCQIRVDTVSFLCILLVPNALPKRERSLWLPPQTVLRQGWLGHYYKSFPDNWDQGSSQVNIYLKKKYQHLTK